MLNTDKAQATLEKLTEAAKDDINISPQKISTPEKRAKSTIYSNLCSSQASQLTATPPKPPTSHTKSTSKGKLTR